jgi:F-type H+-transporting ATPase subunit alpha
MTEFDLYREKTGEVGLVFSVTNSLIYATGLPGAKVGEKVVTENGDIGLVQGLEESAVEILIFNSNAVEPGIQVTRSGSGFEVPVGEAFIGRGIDPLGNALDGLNPVIEAAEKRSINPEVPGINVRQRIDQPFSTGVILIDSMIPLGAGQREVVVGDSKSGKTAFLLQTILNQKGKNIICIYVAIGKKKLDIRQVGEFLKKHDLNSHTILVASDPASNPGIIYLAPFTGMAFAEYFRDQGKDVLLILDDLTTHAKFYREISLQGKKSPGREGYPGDIYFLHSKLLERGGKFKLAWGQSPTITVLPVVESINSDFSGLIPTNIMSMTDGHIFFDTDLMQKGEIPAVNAFLSVSRVGNQTRSPLEKEINFEIRNIMSQYRSTLTFSRFGVELSDASKNLIRVGERIINLFSQNQEEVVADGLRLILFGLLLGGFWDGKMDFQVGDDKVKLIRAYRNGKLKVMEDRVVKIKNLAELKDFVKVNFSQFLKITEAKEGI